MYAPAFDAARSTTPTTFAVPRLHVLTDTRAGRDSLASIAGALRAAQRVATPIAVQVRDKSASDREALELTRRVAAMATESDVAGVWVVVDDRLDVALAAGAHGVHLGANDLPVGVARALAGNRFAVGGTTRNPAGARAVAEAGATYLGVGPCFETSTKDGLPEPLGAERLRAVVQAAMVPVIAIGGVNVERASALLQAGAHGVAVVSAVSQASDPEAATAALLRAVAVCL